MMNTVRVEDQIQLTNIFKTFVKSFDKHLNEIKNPKLRFTAIYTEYEIKRCVVSIDEFAISRCVINKKRSRVFKEVTNAIFSLRNKLECFVDDLLLLIFGLKYF